jgi:predicted nuclease of predicted toxin-antitoxin system
MKIPVLINPLTKETKFVEFEKMKVEGMTLKELVNYAKNLEKIIVIQDENFQKLRNAYLENNKLLNIKIANLEYAVEKLGGKL